jgi:heme-degrading monooxygenase HmoA
MYARKISLSLKSHSTAQFLHKVEHEVLPLFRQQKGFLDYLILRPDYGEMFYIYTFWENREAAEKYDRATFPVLSQLLDVIAGGTLRIHSFAGPGGRLSGN